MTAVIMLDELERARSAIQPEDFREAKRRTLELRTRESEFFEWIAAVRLEEPRN